jgi:hypothetical protein
MEKRWYVAEVVQEFTFEGEPVNVVHCDTLLIQAESAEAAYDEAVLQGADDVYTALSRNLAGPAQASIS